MAETTENPGFEHDSRGDSHGHPHMHAHNHGAAHVQAIALDKPRVPSRFIRVVDNLGVAASALCAVHCLLMPFVLAAVPALESQHALDDRSHQWLAGIVVFFCLIGIVPGFLRHRDKRVLILMSVGLTVVLSATFIVPVMLNHSWEVPLMTFGNMFLIGAHVVNRRLCSCDHKH